MICNKLLALFLAGVLWTVQGKNTYLIYIPKVIRTGFDVSITTSILNATNPVAVTAKLFSKDNTSELQAQAIIDPRSSKRLNLGQLPLGNNGGHVFTMAITGKDLKTNKNVFQRSTKNIVFATKLISILIQTDKANYQPAETIKFRAVCLNPELRPLDGLVKYSVKDPNGNIVLLNTDVPLSHGVAGGELPLNKDAVAGVWKIEYTAMGYKKVLNVEVKLHELPKFEVQVEAPSYVHPQSTGLKIRLKASYTYGKPVKGRAELSLALKYKCGRARWSHITRSTGNQLGDVIFSSVNFQGDETTFIPMSDISNIWTRNNDSSEMKITITGSVTEASTGITFTERIDVDLKQTHIKVETLHTPDTIKPGLSYSAYIKVTEQDGKVLLENDRLKTKLFVNITYIFPSVSESRSNFAHEPFLYPTEVEHKELIVTPDGTARLTFEARDEAFQVVSFSAFAYFASEKVSQDASWDAHRAMSPSNSYMQLTMSHTNVYPNQNVSVTIKTTEAVLDLRIMIISRGVIISDHDCANSDSSTKNHKFQFLVTYDMTPEVQVLTSYVRGDGEIVADSNRLTVSTKLQNQISVNVSSTRVDAGTDVTVRVQTSSAGSYVGVRAIDQNVLLLKSGNNISREQVVNDINENSRHETLFSMSVQAKDATEVLKETDMLVLTDAFLYKSPFNYDLSSPIICKSFNPLSYLIRSIVRRRKPFDSSGATTSKRTRMRLPETWLWDSKITGFDGSVTFQTTAPDTITSWVWSVFSVSDQHGLGLTDNFKINVFRQLMVTLNLPLKVTRGEIVIVQAVVFNYLETNLGALLVLGTSSKFELIIPGNDSVAAGASRIINVPANGSVSVKFPIRANTLGEVPITVTAISRWASDALTQVIFVRPEGIPQCYSSSILINREVKMEEATTHQLQISIPEGVVDGSEKVKLSVYGNILGNTLINLGRLLKAPYGCGEQSMLNFAPDVFVTLYLHKAGILDAATRKKALEHFYNGYMKELSYKHPDGSYSALGPRDKSGSTWLTAFVAKCLIFAREIRPELVEEKIINEALNFLVKQQNEDGSFREPGSVRHKSMQGGVKNKITITAYVLVTLRETNYAFNNKKVMDASNKARAFLENFLSYVFDKKYALAIVTYALQVAGSIMASDALTLLEWKATNKGEMRYWEESIDNESTLKSTWRQPYCTPSTNGIEMTSYALLTYLRRNQIASAALVMKWLLLKQNEHGGYASTQDNVIAIQAMSNAAEMQTNRNQNLTIIATHSDDAQFSQRLHISPKNVMVFNQYDVATGNGNLRIEASGVGVSVAQISVCYNIPNDPYEEEPFACTVKVAESKNSSVLVRFCCGLKPNDTATGTFLFEIGLPNGFTADVPTEEVHNKEAQLVELDEDSLNIYYNNLEPGFPRCAIVKLQRVADVGASKPQPISATDYCNPNRKVTRLLNIENLGKLGACQVCGEECVGCSSAAPSTDKNG